MNPDLLEQLAALARPFFFEGQRLHESDLQGLEALSRQMRWLHNRSLHQPGIGSGYAVSGKKGDKTVTVKPGYALDALGREIVLTTERVMQVPPVAGDGKGGPTWYLLTASYPDVSSLPISETRGGVCSPRGAVRLRVEPVICWARAESEEDKLRAADWKVEDEIANHWRIPLATAQILNCQLYADLAVTIRRNAKPPRQPLVASGQTRLGDCPGRRMLDFSEVEDAEDSEEAEEPKTAVAEAEPASLARTAFTTAIQTRYVCQFDVDTSAASFATTPFYTARIEGPQPKRLTVRRGRQRQAAADLLVDAYLNIVNQSPRGFSAQLQCLLSIASSGSPSRDMLSRIARFPQGFESEIDEWSLVWLGIEA